MECRKAPLVVTVFLMRTIQFWEGDVEKGRRRRHGEASYSIHALIWSLSLWNISVEDHRSEWLSEWVVSYGKDGNCRSRFWWILRPEEARQEPSHSHRYIFIIIHLSLSLSLIPSLIIHYNNNNNVSFMYHHHEYCICTRLLLLKISSLVHLEITRELAEWMLVRVYLYTERTLLILGFWDLNWSEICWNFGISRFNHSKNLRYFDLHLLLQAHSFPGLFLSCKLLQPMLNC